ncbi:MAG: ABC transporter substrate-binding protein [Pseudomonadota bacterium]
MIPARQPLKLGAVACALTLALTGAALYGCGSNTAVLSAAVVDGSEPAPVAETGEGTERAGAPRRIISLDYCADQYVVGLVERDRILRVSPDATEQYSWVRDEARGLPSVHPRAEDVLILQPDLVVRFYGGGPNARTFLERAGVRVLQVPYVSTIADARRNLLELSAALGVAQRGQRLASLMDRRLAAIEPPPLPVEALYMTPSGVSAGSGTLINEMMQTAGLRNFQREPGWHPLPLERLAYERPGLLALAFFDTKTNHADAWSPSAHPVARRQLRELPSVSLDSAWVSCGGWFLVEAVEALAAAGREAVR